MNNIERPNYRWWATVETWTLKQATLLLHGMDPHQHRSLRPYAKNLPPEYAELQKTYLMLQQFPWQEYAPDYYRLNKGITPVAFIHVALSKKLPLPKTLKKWVINRYHLEKKAEKNYLNNQLASEFSPETPSDNPPLSQPKIIKKIFGFTARERKNLLRMLGIFVRIFVGAENTSPRFQYANKLNAYQITQAILEKAKEMNINVHGLKSLDRKITQALALLTAEEAP